MKAIRFTDLIAANRVAGQRVFIRVDFNVPQDDTGRITVAGHGETVVSAWYLSRLAIVTVTSPYANKTDPRVFTKAPRRNFIDELVMEKLQELNLPPSPRSDDGDFLRRAFLDTTGTLPSPEYRCALPILDMTRRSISSELLPRRFEIRTELLLL
jgi:hypothetical protein